MARGTRSRGKKDEATTQVDDRTTAVDQAAAAAVADDAPAAVTTATDAVSSATATEIGTAREVDAELAGQDLELSEEQLAEVIPTPDDDDDGLLGVPGLDDLKNRKPGDDLAGAGGDPDKPSDDPRERAEASKDFNPFGTVQGGGFGAAAEEGSSAALTGTGAAAQAIKDAGIFDLVDQPGETDGDPLTSFLDAADAKLGHNSGLTTPSDQTNESPAHGIGLDGVAKGQHDVRAHTKDDGRVVFTSEVFNGSAGVLVQRDVDPLTGPDDTTVVDVVNGTTTTVSQDGSTKTVDTATGEVIDETPALVGSESVVDLGKIPFTDKHVKFKEGSGVVVEQPDPDEEGAPIPEELTRQLDSDVARLRAARPQTGDGTTDPSEIESEVVGPAGALPDRAEQGRDLFGQPDTEAPTGSDANVNPGADSSGAGVITPGEDQTVSTGRTRNDDPFADAGTAPEPVTSSNDATDSQSFLPSETSGTAIDDKPDVPDPINDPA